ncbi:hypothetical protein ACFSE6_11895 [Georgenia deserti]|uniref:Uncharacterized protein n=2 Tax=Georgenia deserti TaxID=2093781 RepID=A0ABW4L952_9MICO
MVSALLLANAGVSPEDVVADYAVAVRTMAGAPAHGGPGHDRQAAWCDAEVATFLDANLDHVRLFAAAPQNVLDRLGVTDETRSRLRAL